ncbi:MAG: haloacid dehalogenase type II [Phycisphaerales bacterium]|nr:haloacid dehalogenase type II [Phycisphaerales bacterium]
MLDFSQFRALTFDCYGTLIDWEAGILQAIRPVLSVHGVRASDEQVLGAFARLEAAEEAEPYKPYREVLRNVMGRLGREFEVEFIERELDRLPESIRRWPAFPDTVPALARLAERYSINVISNVDNDLFDTTRQRLGLDPEHVVTAELCRAYKPSPRNFRVMLALLDLPTESVLHVAQSRYHDIAPARGLGLSTVWVNRRRGKPGATPPSDAVADLEVPDLAALADLTRPPKEP